MALEDYPYAFNPVVVLDPSTGRPAAGVTVQLRATPDGAALPVGDSLGNPTALMTTELGILPAHRSTVTMPYVWAGSAVALQETAVELMNSLPAALAAQAAAESAAQIVADWEPETLGFVRTEDKGQPDGVASLDSGGKVPVGQLPSGTGGGLDDGDIADLIGSPSSQTRVALNGLYAPAAGSVRFVVGTSSVARGTASTDVCVIFLVGGDVPPVNAIGGVDVWLRTL